MATSHETVDDQPTIFVSYSRDDKKLKDQVLPHLEGLERLGILSVWDDRKIKAGVDWYARIFEVLSNTKVAVCLISPTFLNSSFCMDEEIPYLLQAQNRGDLEIFPILVQDCFWEEHRWLKRLQLLSNRTKPLAKFSKADRHTVLADVARQIREFLGGGKGWERPAPAGDPPDKVDITRLPETTNFVFGRQDKLNQLDRIWNDNTLNVAVFKASGGVGKSSLVRAWVEDMALDNYRGAGRVFAWSFYSQGTGDGQGGSERVTSADEFISHALGWFGDESKGEGLSPWDRGQRLAELVREKRTLLLLDGLEPLQSGQAYDRGKIKDVGLEVLLDELGRSNPGLCLISTREEVSDLWHEKDQCQVGQFDLDTISTTAGRALLRVSGIEGEDAALEQAVQDFGQHAYAAKLLGSFLTWSGKPTIERTKEIPDLPKVGEKDGKHPRRVMAAFAERFGDSAKADILAMLGLFDRPADAGCIATLREAPAVPGLNAAILPISEATWQEQINELRKLGLLTPESLHAPDELDAHPLIREHFGARLRAHHEEAWKAGHERLYEYLKTETEFRPSTIHEMAPLFHAVRHGCEARRYEETLYRVFVERIVRWQEGYLVHKLGAFSTELALVSFFFANSWEQPLDALSKNDHAWLLGNTAFILRGVGRLNEAATAMQAGMELAADLHNWMVAATGAANLSETLATIGDIRSAVEAGERAVRYADRSGNIAERITARTTLADALLCKGSNHKASLSLFRDAETLLDESPFNAQQLFGIWNNKYCKILIELNRVKKAYDRSSYALNFQIATQTPLAVALNSLSMGKAAVKLGKPIEAEQQLNLAIEKLREAGTIHQLPSGLLARADFFCKRDPEKSKKDIKEAMRLATRCGMRLFECDAHLEYARLEIKQGQRGDAKQHLEKAAKLVKDCGYHRRDDEVAALRKELGGDAS